MKRSTWFVIGGIALAVIGGGGYYLYSQAVNLVSDEIESAKRRIDRNDDGSVLEWSGYEVKGISVEMTDFHYYDARENYEIFADRLLVSKRVGENYSGEFDNLVIQMGKHDVYEVQSGYLENFNAAEDIEDFTSEKTVFNGFRWAVNDATPFVLTMDSIEFDNFDRLHVNALIMDEIQADFETEKLKFNAPDARIDDLVLLSREEYFQLDGILYSNFEIPELTGTWHEKPVLNGAFSSQGKLDKKTGLLEQAYTSLTFDFDIDAEDFRQYALVEGTANKRTLDFFDSLGVESYQGHFEAVGRLAEGATVGIEQELSMPGLGSQTSKAEFSGYSTEFMQDVDQYRAGEALPESFSEFSLVGAEFIYEDEVLADSLLTEYMRIDPALVSFLAQMTLPRYLPNDPQLVRDTANGVSNFLNNKNYLGIGIHPAEPVPLSEVFAILNSDGPYQEPLGIVVVGK